MAEFHDPKEMKEQEQLYLLDAPEEIYTPEETTEIQNRVEDILLHMEEIDSVIDSKTEGWKTSRMAKVDLTLIRVAYYEIAFEKLSEKVAINEAVELAKKYGEDNAPSFVNGVLARLV